MIDVKFSELVGKTLKAVKNTSDTVEFETDNGEKYRLYHSQSCCESVKVEEVHGDLDDLIGSPILSAKDVSSDKPTPKIIRERAEEEIKDREQAKADGREYYGPYHADSETWTFYKIATIKGSVTIRFYGSSNGYYSESVDFVRVS